MSQAPSERPSTLRIALDVITTVCLIAASIVVIFRFLGSPVGAGRARRPPIEVPTEPLTLDGTPTLGSPAARIAVIEFSDFECPFCGRFVTDVLPQLRKEYVDTGLVRLSFRHRPLEQIHKRARHAAEAAECALRQGRFWEFHEHLFSRTPVTLDDRNLVLAATTLGLDVAQFDTCRTGDVSGRVQQDIDLADMLRISGTPTFLVGTVSGDGRVNASDVVSGIRPFSEFAEIIERLRTTLN